VIVDCLPETPNHLQSLSQKRVLPLGKGGVTLILIPNLSAGG
jgi:hypothetical protein